MNPSIYFDCFSYTVCVSVCMMESMGVYIYSADVALSCNDGHVKKFESNRERKKRTLKPRSCVHSTQTAIPFNRILVNWNRVHVCGGDDDDDDNNATTTLSVTGRLMQPLYVGSQFNGSSYVFS